MAKVTLRQAAIGKATNPFQVFVVQAQLVFDILVFRHAVNQTLTKITH